MLKPGNVVIVDFPGATGTKRRPAVIISSTTYHKARPDIVLALLTSQVAKAIEPTDYVLKDWAKSGLRSPSAFRAYIATMPSRSATAIGHLSDRDWREVQDRLRTSLAIK
jgi:mRNA interferase MazF